MTRALACSTLLALLAAACSDSLVDDTFRGDPIWQVDAVVVPGTSSWSKVTDLRMALFFSPNGPGDLEPSHWKELVGSSRPVPVPADATLNVFEAPTSDLFAHEGGRTLGYAVGRLAFYEDKNGDGRLDGGESIVSIQGPSAYLYAPRELAAGEGPTAGAVPAGFNWVVTPQACGDPPPATTPGSGDCGVPLGEACTTNADCTGGVCVQQLKLSFPKGYCAIPEPPPDGCRPEKGVFWHRADYAPYPPGVQGYWVRACQKDADCLRGNGARSDQYRCDPGLRACVPNSLGLIAIGAPPESQVEPFCARDVVAPAHGGPP